MTTYNHELQYAIQVTLFPEKTDNINSLNLFIWTLEVDWDKTTNILIQNGISLISLIHTQHSVQQVNSVSVVFFNQQTQFTGKTLYNIVVINQRFYTQLIPCKVYTFNFLSCTFTSISQMHYLEH